MKRELFDEESEDETTLRVNAEFAEKFERRERRKELERLNQEIEENEESSGESSSDYSEDSQGALVNQKVEEKFMQALVDIREGNLKTQEPYFSDDDFDIDDEGLIKTQDKTRKTYKDLIRERAEEESDESEDEFEMKRKMLETPNQEQARIKKEFIDAAESGSEGDEGFLLKTKKEEGRDLGLIEQEDLKLDEFMKKSKQAAAPKEYDLLEKFWGKDEELNSNDKFLRNYILAEGWKGASTNKMQEADLEDQLREEEMEDYEEKYNFRFEEKQGANIMTHARNTDDTLRIKDTSRKTKREALSKRKAEEKRKKIEQLKRIRQLKKQEILDKLKQVEHQSGEALDQEQRQLLETELETEFDPVAYDLTMNDAFVEERPKEEQKSEEESEQEEREEIQVEAMENAAQKGIWYVCDNCLKPIKAGKPRYEQEKVEDAADDFTLCTSCYRTQSSHHRFKKLMIPKVCKPPGDADAIISRQFVACVECKKQLADKKIKALWCEQDQTFYCSKCAKKNENRSVRKVTEEELMQLEGHKPASEVKQQIDAEYDQLEFEDIIGNDLPTRFKYEPVVSEGYGLQDEELLYLQDKSLNSLLSLKKLAPYQEEPRIDTRKIQFQKKKLQGEVKQKKREIKNLRKERAQTSKAVKQQGIKFEDFVEEEKPVEEKKKVKESRRVAYGA